MFILLLGLGLRLMDLTDAPLDFHPVRQLRGALISRAMYYSLSQGREATVTQEAQALAGSLEPLEPPILEAIVAFGEFLAGGEYLWIVRILNAGLWLIGAWLLYRLGLALGRPPGALVGLGYFAVLPLGVSVTRSFQPDALMLLLLIALTYALWHYLRNPSWRWAIWVGLAGGTAILVKGRIALMVVVAIAVAILATQRLRQAITNPRNYALTTLVVVIPASYYLLLVPGSTASNLATFTQSVAWLLAQPSYYIRLLGFLDRRFSLPLLAIGVLGVLLSPGHRRWLLLSLWAGFVAYTLSVPYHSITHDYYVLPLILPASLSLVAAFDAMAAPLEQLHLRWHASLVLLGLLTILYPAWGVRSGLLGTDYRPETLGWVKLGRELPRDGSIIGFTHDYGYRLAYYGWRMVFVWPASYDRRAAEMRGESPPDSAEEQFAAYADGHRYFLVTDFTEWEAQSDLAAYIESRFPVAMQGDGYLLFDLAPSD